MNITTYGLKFHKLCSKFYALNNLYFKILKILRNFFPLSLHCTESSIHDIEERISNQPNIQEATVTDTILAKCKEDTPGYNTATPKKKKLRLQLKRLRSRHSKLVKKLNYPPKKI
ncbi:hypothetical protein Avbf_02523 [Armadillidium vulgare]|nr:hypothetical protein Avbf_02523 [Armadillidium vulgare]